MIKILLVDDDPDVRLMMGKILYNEGYEVEGAAGWQEAIIKLMETKPAVILLDVLLSGDDGRELCRQIKDDENLKHIPVIMLSGHPGAVQNFQAYGADDFIAKPFNTEFVLSKLKLHTGGK